MHLHYNQVVYLRYDASSALIFYLYQETGLKAFYIVISLTKNLSGLFKIK